MSLLSKIENFARSTGQEVEKVWEEFEAWWRQKVLHEAQANTASPSASPTAAGSDAAKVDVNAQAGEKTGGTGAS